MKTLKKSLCLVLAVVMVVGVLAVSASAATFTDAKSIQYKEAVNVLSAINVIDGIGDGSFAPTATLTREQGAAIVIRAAETRAVADLLSTSATTFADVPATWWSAGVVTEAAALGIVDGYDGKFAPTDTLTGAQFAKMLLVAIGVEGEYTGANWQNNVIRAAAKAGLADGLTTAVYTRGITREEACQMAWNALQYSPNGKTTTYVVTVPKTATVTDEDGIARKIYVDANGNEVSSSADAAQVEVYSGTNEEYSALVVAVREDAKLTKKEVAEGSISDVVYNLSRDTSEDAFGRPTIEVSDGKKVKVVVSSDSALLTYSSTVKGETIYKALNLKEATDFTLIVNGVSETIKLQYNSTELTSTTVDEDGTKTLIPVTGNGITTEVYKNVDAKEGEPKYTIVVVQPFFTNVDRLRNVNDGNGGKVLTTCFTDGRTTTDFTNFEEDDAVIYTYSYKTKKVESAELAQTVSGVLTMAVQNKSFTIGNTVYGISGINVTVKDENGNTSTQQNNLVWNIVTGNDSTTQMGKEVTYYVDNYGNLISNAAIIKAARPNYIYVLASDKPAIDTRSYLYKDQGDEYVGYVYGILSDGTYGEFMVAYGAGEANTTGKYAGLEQGEVYTYTVKSNGDLEITGGDYQKSNSSALYKRPAGNVVDVTVTKSGQTYVTERTGSKTYYYYLNSATDFMFYQSGKETYVLTSFASVVGNKNCGIFANGVGVYDEDNVIETVFIAGRHSDDSTSNTVVYVDAESSSKVVTYNNDGTVTISFTYTAITSEGNEITVSKTVKNTNGSTGADNPIQVSGLYECSEKNVVGDALVEGTDYEAGTVTSKGSTLVIQINSTPNRAYNYDPSNVAFVGDDTRLKEGQTVYAIIKDTYNIVQMWVEDAPEAD